MTTGGWQPMVYSRLYGRGDPAADDSRSGSVAWDLLAPQAERFLGGAVGEAEQHGLGAGLMLDPAPRRRDEHVLLLPLEGLAVDARAAAALDHAVDGAVGRAVGPAAEVPGQTLHEGADGGHRVAARRRVGVLQLDAVARMDVAAAAQLVERSTRADVGIAEHRRRERLRLVSHRQQVAPVARPRIALRPYDRLGRLGIALHETRVKVGDERHVEPVQPYHRVGSRIAVVVPSPRRRDDEIARVHGHALAVHGGIGALALD